jgi:hypothetical protein
MVGIVMAGHAVAAALSTSAFVLPVLDSTVAVCSLVYRSGAAVLWDCPGIG